MAAEKRGTAHKSRTHRPLREYKQTEGWNVLALSNGKVEGSWQSVCRLPAAVCGRYATPPSGPSGGKVLILSVHTGCGQEHNKRRNMGNLMEVLKVVSSPDGEGSTLLCAATGGLERSPKETRALFEHRNSANFHVLCPEIIVVYSRTAPSIRERQLAVLTLEYPEVDCGDIMDERVLTSNGLRLLGSLKDKEITGAKDRSRRYKKVEADVVVGCYVLCQIAFERGDVRLWRVALSAALPQRGLGSHVRGAQVLVLCTKTFLGWLQPPHRSHQRGRS